MGSPDLIVTVGYSLASVDFCDGGGTTRSSSLSFPSSAAASLSAFFFADWKRKELIENFLFGS
jgi:hypothetical protein